MSIEVPAVVRPRLFLDTLSTVNVNYVDLVRTEISKDAKGVNFFTFSLDPDPNALYNIVIGDIYKKLDLALAAVFTLQYPMLLRGLYRGFHALAPILIQHKTTNPAITVTTSFTLSLAEVLR